MPRRIVTGHDAAGKSVVLSAGPNPKTLEVVQRGTNHAWANRSDQPVPMLFVLIDGTITDELRAATGPLSFFDQTLS